MIPAEHIIGLSTVELGRYHYQAETTTKTEIAQAAKRRFNQICRQGHLTPRGNVPRDLIASHGSQQEWDLLAGDGKYIFLSAGPRYREARESRICYGFIFDAEKLIRAGALVGPDLLASYEDLADEVAEGIEATLPPPQPISDSELDQFAATMGINDPEMLEFIRTDSARYYHDIISGMERGDKSIPGVSEALALWHKRVAALQATKRRRGPEALALLHQIGANGALEVLVEGRLNVNEALATIEAGQIVHRCRRCWRPLRDPASVAAGYGPRCQRIEGAK